MQNPKIREVPSRKGYRLWMKGTHYGWRMRHSDLDPEQTTLHAGRSIQSALNLLFFVNPVQTCPAASPTLNNKEEGEEK